MFSSVFEAADACAFRGLPDERPRAVHSAPSLPEAERRPPAAPGDRLPDMGKPQPGIAPVFGRMDEPPALDRKHRALEPAEPVETKEYSRPAVAPTFSAPGDWPGHQPDDDRAARQAATKLRTNDLDLPDGFFGRGHVEVAPFSLEWDRSMKNIANGKSTPQREFVRLLSRFPGWRPGAMWDAVRNDPGRGHAGFPVEGLDMPKFADAFAVIAGLAGMVRVEEQAEDDRDLVHEVTRLPGRIAELAVAYADDSKLRDAAATLARVDSIELAVVTGLQALKDVLRATARCRSAPHESFRGIVAKLKLDPLATAKAMCERDWPARFPAALDAFAELASASGFPAAREFIDAERTRALAIVAEAGEALPPVLTNIAVEYAQPRLP